MALQQTLKVVVQNPGHPTWQEVSPYSLEAGKDNGHLCALKSPVPWTGISAWFKPWLVADCSFSNCFPECVETVFLCPPRKWDAPHFFLHACCHSQLAFVPLPLPSGCPVSSKNKPVHNPMFALMTSLGFVSLGLAALVQGWRVFPTV